MWIKCNEKMPDNERCVLVYGFIDFEETFINWYKARYDFIDNKWIFHDRYTPIGFKPTHWMDISI